MHVSAKTDYAIRALVELAITDGPPVTGNQIAANQGTPKRFTLNILRVLRQHGLVSSRRGSGGGSCSPDRRTTSAWPP
jgi:Rrf2 family protein